VPRTTRVGSSTGVAQGFPNTEVLYVDHADLPSVQATVASKLQQDPSITHIVALGGPVAVATVQAKADAGNTTAKITTFDLNADVAKAIKDGQIEFSIDQQPYVQGFMAVAGLWMNITNGNDMGGGPPVLTGPSIVDSSNIDVILPFAERNRR
jgi:simple sugar transport system substrate-binding protein